MADIASQSLPPTWGLRPILWQSDTLRIESYPFFVILGIIAGLLVFWLLARRERAADEQSFYIVITALVGGAIGAKLPIWIVHIREIMAALPDIGPLLSGRTIVGGLIGGTLSVWWIKRKLRIKRRIGNAIAPAAALGIAIGRIGCLLRGCCFGITTDTGWGVDFGDGILRYPTQLFESVFMLILFVVLLLLLKNKPKEGALFTLFIVTYFFFRFWIEFVRSEPRILFGLTGFQYTALTVLTYYAMRILTTRNMLFHPIAVH